MHSGCADPCEFPKCGNLDCIISGSGGLRSRSPLILCGKKIWGLVLACCAAVVFPPRWRLPAAFVLVSRWLARRWAISDVVWSRLTFLSVLSIPFFSVSRISGTVMQPLEVQFDKWNCPKSLSKRLLNKGNKSKRKCFLFGFVLPHAFL